MRYHKKLSPKEREELFRLAAQHLSVREIARRLDRHHATISRELRRDGMDKSTYSIAKAQVDRNIKASQVGVKRKIVSGRKLFHWIKHHLVELRWSPEQISNRLKKESKSTRWRISHETIYRFIYSLEEQSEKRLWINSLRRKKKKRGPNKYIRGKQSNIANRISIHDRPEHVEDRIEMGHWEGDLIIGKDHKSAIGTLVERTSRLTLIVGLPEGKTSDKVVKAFAKKLENLPAYLKKSLTYDNGSEMALHEDLSNSIGIKIYFCDPGSPGQRGTNENTNGLIRDFFPKRTDFSEISEDQLMRVERLLNERPRKILGYECPQNIFWCSYGPEPPNRTPTPERRGEQW